MPSISPLQSWSLSVNSVIDSSASSTKNRPHSPLAETLLELTQGVLRCDAGYGSTFSLFGTGVTAPTPRFQQEYCESQPLSKEEVEIEYADPILHRVYQLYRV